MTNPPRQKHPDRAGHAAGRSAVGLLVLACAVSVAGIARGERPEPPADDSHDLVRQLGDDDFAVRRRAARLLRERGLSARTALVDGLRQPDLEIRLRSRQILLEIQQTDFDLQIIAFLDGDPSAAFEFAGWEACRKLVEDDRVTRVLFVDMMRYESPLLDALQRDDERLDQLYLNRVQEMQSDAFAAIQGKKPLATSGIGALLLVGAARPDHPVANSRVYSLLSYPTTREALTNGPHSKALLRLLEAWILAPADDARAYRCLSLALTYDLAEPGLALARERLQSVNSSKLVLQFAAVTVGRFGSDEDIPLLEPHLTNRSLCTTFPIKNQVINTQVGDVVLAMLVHLAHHAHADYGFEHLQADERTLFALHKLGFESDEKRTAAMERWSKQESR